MKIAQVDLITGKLSGEISPMAKDFLLLVYKKYNGLVKCNKRFKNSGTAKISYSGNTVIDFKVDYSGSGDSANYSNQILRMWVYSYIRNNLALPTRISVTQTNCGECLNSLFLPRLV